MLDQNKINQFAVKAKAAGYSDAQIAAEVARKKKELEDQQKATVTQPASGGMDMNNPGFTSEQPTVEQPKKGGLVSNLKSAGNWIANTFFPATKNFVQDVSSGLFVGSKDYDAMVKSNQQAQEMNRKLVERAKQEKDPVKKKELLDFARKQSQDLADQFNAAQPQFSKDVEKNPIERGLAVGTEIGTSIVTPEAKGATAGARVLSAAKQGAMISGSRAATSLEEMTPEERLKKTLVDSGLGALTVGTLQVGGEVVGKLASGSKATTNIGKNVKDLGSEVRQGVRKIREPAGVWGASKEEAINGTLDKLGISGTAEQQYIQLEPAYEKLTKSIGDFLKEKGKPVDPKKIQALVTKDLQDIPGDVLAEAQGKAEFSKITKEIAKIKDSQSIFDMKKWLNGRLGRVYTKLEKGNPLSPAEEVLLQSRDTIDQAITKLHPEIKDLTITQSHLRDAAPSLAKARLVVPTQRVAGTTVPVSISQRATDKFGKVLQKTGGTIEKVGQGEEKVFGFAQKPVDIAVKGGQKVAPVLVSPSMPFENVPNPTDNTQGNETQPGNNENGQSANGNLNQHGASSIAKTVTGRTVEEHLRALSKAQAAGDTAAVKAIQKQLDIEQTYQKQITTAKPKTEQQLARDMTAQMVADLVNQFAENKDIKTGIISPRVEEAKAIFNLGDQATMDFYNTAANLKATLAKARGGTSFTPNEEALLNKYTPNIGDSKQQLQTKIKGLIKLFNESLSVPIVSEATLENSLGGFSSAQ